MKHLQLEYSLHTYIVSQYIDSPCKLRKNVELISCLFSNLGTYNLDISQYTDTRCVHEKEY